MQNLTEKTLLKAVQHRRKSSTLQLWLILEKVVYIHKSVLYIRSFKIAKFDNK